MAVILSTWPLGNALGLLTEPGIAEAFGWQWASVLCLLVALCYRAAPL